MTLAHQPTSLEDATDRLEEFVLAARDGAIFNLIGSNGEACVLIGARAFDALTKSEKPSEG